MRGIPIKSSPDLSLSGTAEQSTWMAWPPSPDGDAATKLTPRVRAKEADMPSPVSPGYSIPELPSGITFEAFASQAPTRPAPQKENLTGLSSSSKSTQSTKLTNPASRRSTRRTSAKRNETGAQANGTAKKLRASAPRAQEAALLREVDELRKKNKVLRQLRWDLENEIASLQAKIMTDEDEMQSVDATEQELSHARRYVRALKSQVRALGGYVFDASDEEADSGRESDGGELPASYPKAAANLNEFTMPAIRARRALRRKKRW